MKGTYLAVLLLVTPLIAINEPEDGETIEVFVEAPTAPASASQPATFSDVCPGEVLDLASYGEFTPGKFRITDIDTRELDCGEGEIPVTFSGSYIVPTDATVGATVSVDLEWEWEFNDSTNNTDDNEGNVGEPGIQAIDVEYTLSSTPCFDLLEITSNDYDSACVGFPFTMETDLELDGTKQGDSEFNWTADLGSPQFEPTSGANNTSFWLGEPFVEKGQKVDGKITVEYTGSRSVVPNTRDFSYKLVEVSFDINETEDTGDDQVIVYPSADYVDSLLPILEWIPVTVNHTRGCELEIEIKNDDLVFYKDKAAPTATTTGTAKSLKAKFLTGDTFYIATKTVGTGELAFTATGDLGDGSHDIPVNVSLAKKPFEIKLNDTKETNDDYLIVVEDSDDPHKIKAEVSVSGATQFTNVNFTTTSSNIEVVDENTNPTELEATGKLASSSTGVVTAELQTSLGTANVNLDVDLVTVGVEFANRDEPDKTVEDLASHNGDVIYSGDDTGDLVKWKLPAINGKTYTWKATNTFTDEVINGPTGVNENEWLIDGTGLDWDPGDYILECNITDIGKFEKQYEIGWRTKETIIVGQIVEYEHVSIDDDSEDLLREALAYHVVSDFQDKFFNIKLPGQFGTHELAIVLVEAVESLNGTKKLVEFLAGLAALDNKADVNLGPLRLPGGSQPSWDAHLFAIQEILNANTDEYLQMPSPSFEKSFISSNLEKDNGIYRVYNRFQANIVFEQNGTIRDARPTTSETQYFSLGPTKLNIGVARDEFTLEIGEIDFKFPSTDRLQFLTLEEAEHNPNSGIKGGVGAKYYAQYASGRIAEKGQLLNLRLLGRDAPWIWVSPIYSLDADGSVKEEISTSTDILYDINTVSVIRGDCAFNEIFIYERGNKPGTYETYNQKKVLTMKGKLKCFVDSVAHGVRDEQASKTIIK